MSDIDGPRRGCQAGGMTDNKPLVRKVWWIAMAIVGATLLTLVWLLFPKQRRQRLVIAHL